MVKNLKEISKLSAGQRRQFHRKNGNKVCGHFQPWKKLLKGLKLYFSIFFLVCFLISEKNIQKFMTSSSWKCPTAVFKLKYRNWVAIFKNKMLAVFPGKIAFHKYLKNYPDVSKMIHIFMGNFKKIAMLREAVLTFEFMLPHFINDWRELFKTSKLENC